MISNAAKIFDVLATSISIHNYFHSSTKLFLSLYLAKFLDIFAKLFFSCNVARIFCTVDITQYDKSHIEKTGMKHPYLFHSDHILGHTLSFILYASGRRREKKGSLSLAIVVFPFEKSGIRDWFVLHPR